MLCFSDYILSQSPWAYCRLNEPEGHNIYCDLSGKSNHLFAEPQNGAYVQAAENQKQVNYLGEPAIAGIQPINANRTLKVDSIDWAIPSTALKFTIPQFKSDIYIYRSGERVQNDLSITSMWIDILLDPTTEVHEAALKPMLPTLYAQNGSRASINHIYTSDEWDFTSGYSGERTSVNICEKPTTHRMFETLLIMGPLCLVAESGVHFNCDGSYIGPSLHLKIVLLYQDGSEMKELVLWKRTLVTVDAQSDPAQPFTAGAHRFTIGIQQISTQSCLFSLSIDGANAVSSTTNFSGLAFFALSIHPVYSRMALLNKTTFSNVALFFNKPFPSNAWLSASQLALTTTYHSAICSRPAHSIIYGTPAVQKLPGNLLSILDTCLILGNRHSKIYSSTLSGGLTMQVTASSGLWTPSGGLPSSGTTVTFNANKQAVFSGCWRVQSTAQSVVVLIPDTDARLTGVINVGGTDHIALNMKITSASTLTLLLDFNHPFRPGDLVLVSQWCNSVQSHTWRVSGVTSDQFTITAESVSAQQSFNQDAIIKQCAIGGGSGWQRITSTDKATYRGTSITAAAKQMIVDDTQTATAKLSLSNLDDSSPSEEMHFLKQGKNTINKDPNRSPWKAIGDAHRFYLFMPWKQNCISQTSLVVMGEIRSWFNDDACVVLIAYDRDSFEQNCGFNYAFTYPKWSLMVSGHLLCQSVASAQSDARWVSRENLVNTNLLRFADSGHHIYPIDIPYTTDG